MRFWGKILNSYSYLCNKNDIMQLCLVFSFFFLNTLHLLLLESTVVTSDYWLRTLDDQDSWQVMIG